MILAVYKSRVFAVQQRYKTRFCAVRKRYQTGVLGVRVCTKPRFAQCGKCTKRDSAYIRWGSCEFRYLRLKVGLQQLAMRRKEFNAENRGEPPRFRPSRSDARCCTVVGEVRIALIRSRPRRTVSRGRVWRDPPSVCGSCDRLRFARPKAICSVYPATVSGFASPRTSSTSSPVGRSKSSGP